MTQSPIRYVAITTIDDEKFIVRVAHETRHGIVGIEVDRDGEEVIPGDGFHNRKRIVARETIKKIVEMRMNVIYGRMEKAK